MNDAAKVDEGSLFTMHEVSKTFGGTSSLFKRARPPVQAVDRVLLNIKHGETLGLVGETGSGKSTIGRLALRLVDPDRGSILLGGMDLTRLSEAEMRRQRSRIQMVFQDPFGSLDPRMTVWDLVREPMIVHRAASAEIDTRFVATMRLVGLDPALAGRYPHEFSGGQRQRIGIARALVLIPQLLVLDEPVSALDVSIQAQILNLLRDVQRRTGISYLFIAHDLAVVRHVSTRVAVMYLGRIVEIGPRDLLYGAPKHPYTVSLLSAVPTPDPVRERMRRRAPLIGEIGSASAMPAGCNFHPRCARARAVAASGQAPTCMFGSEMLPERCVAEVPPLAEVEAGHFSRVPLRYNRRGAVGANRRKDLMSETREANYRGVFDGSIGFGERPAIIVIDFIRAYTTPGEAFFALGVVNAVEESVELLATARRNQVPVIYTKVLYHPRGADGGLFVRKVPALRKLVAGEPMAEIDSRVRPAAQDLVIAKNYPSCFFGTSLASSLIGLKVDTTILVGCSTSGCVRATAVDAIQYGFRVIVPRECVGDRHEGPHDASLFDINAKYGDVLPKVDVIARLAANA